MTSLPRYLLTSLLVVALALVAGYALFKKTITRQTSAFEEQRIPLSHAELQQYCEDAIGPARVERLGENIFVAIGYDLANVILVRNGEHGLLIDTAMSPTRAKEVRAALLAVSPGPIQNIVLTHSHIDHIGGLATWIDGEAGDVEVWATDAFAPHLFKQYGSFREAETRRGARQFGRSVAHIASPCSGIGRHADVDAALSSGVRLPTKTFSGSTRFMLGDMEVELHEAHGETHDQLYVHIPALSAVFPGDNWYRTFPNLYTIRGTSPRPVTAWVDSLDAMRALEPAYLVPSHTRSVEGREEIQRALTVYRDGIQWVRDQTTRAANRGDSLDQIAANVGLPPELQNEPTLREFYGQIDWSVRAIYNAELGWFDGTVEALYPLPPAEFSAKTIAAMGGEAQVFRLAQDALKNDDPRWALQLLRYLDDQPKSSLNASDLNEKLIEAIESVADTVSNTNGRSYLLEVAHERQQQPRPLNAPTLDAAMVQAIPLRTIFQVMQSKLIPERAAGVHETLHFEIGELRGVDGPERLEVFLTVRNRVAELAYERVMPGTPEPVATIRCSAQTWRELSLGLKKPAALVASGELVIDGGALQALRFLDMFDRTL